MNQKEIRWRQRFDNFEKAYKLLEKYADLEQPSEVERAGIIQFFEMALEIAWKVMKDYLEAQEFQVRSPREAIKQASQMGILDDGKVWLEALEDRNLTVHTYDEQTAVEIVQRIRMRYFPALQQFYLTMKGEY